MMWVCRSGKKAIFNHLFLENSRIFLAWEGYRIDLRSIKDRKSMREIVAKETLTDNQVSISNWAGQLFSFAFEMKKGDLVLIPNVYSRSYILARITGDYEYDAIKGCPLAHSRTIEVKLSDIPRGIFPQDIIYSLGAYRTLFKVRDSDSVMDKIIKWNNMANFQDV